MKDILVGSRSFFGSMPYFNSKDTDYVRFEKLPDGEIYQRLVGWKTDYFIFGTTDKEVLLDFIESTGDYLHVAPFLSPAVCKIIGFRPEELPRIEKYVKLVPPKYRYYEKIYNAYVENDDFYLTEEQRAAAYKVYREARKNEQK